MLWLLVARLVIRLLVVRLLVLRLLVLRLLILSLLVLGLLVLGLGLFREVLLGALAPLIAGLAPRTAAPRSSAGFPAGSGTARAH